jgi:hypothetical protein
MSRRPLRADGCQGPAGAAGTAPQTLAAASTGAPCASRFSVT